MLALINPSEYSGVAKGGGVTTVTTAGTRVRITATETPVTGVIIQAFETNTGYVAVGGSDVVAANGTSRVCMQMLGAGQSMIAMVRDLSLLYIDATANTCRVNYFPILS